MPFLLPVFTIGRADRAARRWRLALALFVVFAGVTNAAAARATVLAMPKAADAAYAAAYVSQVVPSLIEVFTPTSVSVTMRNTGTATWIASEGDVFLSTQEPQDRRITRDCGGPLRRAPNRDGASISRIRAT